MSKFNFGVDSIRELASVFWGAKLWFGHSFCFELLLLLFLYLRLHLIPKLANCPASWIAYNYVNYALQKAGNLSSYFLISRDLQTTESTVICFRTWPTGIYWTSSPNFFKEALAPMGKWRGMSKPEHDLLWISFLISKHINFVVNIIVCLRFLPLLSARPPFKKGHSQTSKRFEFSQPWKVLQRQYITKD